MYIVKTTRLPPVNVRNTTHARVPGIGIELKGIVHHTLAQGGKGIEACHPLTQGEKGMNADHALIQIQGKGGGTADLIQGRFTQTRGIIDHEHDHIQNPETVTVTLTLEVMQWILCRANITQDHDHDHHYVQVRGTVTNLLQTLAQTNDMSDHNPDRH